MAKGDGFKLFEDRVGAKLAEKSSGAVMDWGTIFEILSALIPLIADCFGSRGASSAPRLLRRRFGRRAQLAAALRRNMGMSFMEALETSSAVCECADECSDDELKVFVEDCIS